MRLRRDHKSAIVQGLACFYTPTEVQEQLQETFHVKVSLQQIGYYDPEQKSDLADEWVQLHKTTREKFIEESSSVPISHRSVRLRRFDDLYHKAVSMRNYSLAKEMLVEAARDSGGFYTNKHKLEHTGKDGKPLPAAPAVIRIVFVRPTDRAAPE